MVDAAGEGQGPAVVKNLSGDGDLELGVGAFGGNAFAEGLVPLCAELGAPNALATAAGLMRAEVESRQFTDAQRGGALLKIEVQAGGWCGDERESSSRNTRARQMKARRAKTGRFLRWRWREKRRQAPAR